MAESQLRTLYESLRRDNYDVPGTYESFERTLTAPGKEGVTNRQTLYNSLHADGYDVPDTYESFANTLFVPQPKQQAAPASQAVAEAPAPTQKTQAAGKATAPVQKAQPQVRAQTRPTSQQPTGTVAAFKLRRGGHDFYVTQQEVNEAGGLGAWAAKHPGAPVRVYMHGDGFTGHVDLSEASKRRKEKGYKYTLEYRPGHKVKRNKSGWVDNLVEYGQEAKAIEEMTAPTKQVVEQLWSAAEKKQTTDARNNYDALNNKWSRTGDDMPFVDSSVRYLANETDRMKNFDLDKMSEEAWRRSGAALTQKVYQRLKLANPKTDDSKLIEQAEAEAWRLTNKAVYDYAVEKNMPKSVLEYFFKKVMDQNSVVSLLRGTARSMAGTTGDRGAYEAAQEEYGKKHKVADVAGTVVGMGADPMMTLTGGAGGAAGKAVLNVGGRLIARKAAGTAVETGTRLFANKLGAKVAAGVASGSVNLGMYEGLKEGERQFLHGGYINPETGQNEGYSLQAMFESAGKGAILGAATGVISPIFGNVGNKLVGKADRISSTGGSMAAKAGIRATQHLVATGLEGTIFATEGWLTTDEDKMDVWLDSMATMIGFKGHHIIKSAPRVIAGMRPVKPTADRPLTIDERNFNRKSFVERVSAMLDGPKFADERRNGSGMPLSFTKDDISTLKEAGYGSLADIFRSDRAKEADKPFEERVLDALGEDESTAEMSNGSGGLLDGYSEMEKLVKDASVPQEIRAKAYYALTGHCLGAGTITGHATRETDDGRIAVDALTNNGEIVYRRYYKSKDAANAATEKLDRQIELNKIDVGEQYADAVADETILDDVIKAQYPDNNPENIKKIYYGVKYGKARADEHLRKGIDAIDKEIEARKDEAADMRPDAIRKAYGEEYGVDIDDAIRKPSGDRSEAEKSAVESYIARLFASGETRVDRYDSKSDSYVSDVSDVADAADVAETQPETQPIGRATMKFQDGPVEVLSGRVVMTEDGKMVDVERSDKTIVVRDPATGKTEMVSPEAMLSYEDVAPEVAADERSMPKYSSGRIVIRDADGKERRGFLTGYVDENGNHEYYVEGDLQHLHYASEHELNNILSEYQPDEPQQPSAEQPQAAERAYPEGVNDTEAYENGLEDGAASTSMSDEDLNRNIERFSDENEVSSLTDYGRGWIEGLKQEQQRRIQAAQPEQPQQPEPAQAPAEAMQGEVNMPTGVNPVGTISVPQRDGSTRTFTVGKDAEGNNIVVDDRGFMWAHDGNGNAMQPYSPGANVPVWTDEQLSKLGAVQPANEHPATVPNQPENVPTSGETPQNPTENAVSPAESVPNPAAPVENVQETPAPTAELTPLQRIPRDEKGEPIFEQAETPEIAWDALVEFSDGDVADAKEMADIVTEQKRKALEKFQKQKPKGASLAELRESQKVIKAAREQAEQEYNFWQQMAGVEQLRQEAEARRHAEERAEADRAEAEEKKRKAALDKRLRDTFEDVKDVPEAVEVLEDMDPRDIYEAAAQLLSGQKVLWGDAGVKVGARSETGFGEEERRRLFGLFASEANGGKSLSRLAEDAMKQQCEAYGIPYDNQDARNALIDVISGARTVGDIRNYIANNRIDEARRLAEAKRRHEEEQYDEFCRQEYHLSAEEVEAYEDQLLAELSERDIEFDANEYNDYIADEMARAAEITEQQKNGTGDNDTRRGSTPGDRRVQENDTEGKGTVPGRGYEVLPESRADQSSGAAADGGRSEIQPADGVQGDGPASAVAQGAQRGGIAAVGRRKADDSPYGGLAEEVTSAIGPFGKIYTQFSGKPREAVTFLLAKRDGEAIGALHHKDVGEIDLVWGEEGSAHSDGFGLAKLAKYHPEVLFNLQEILNDMAVTKRSANRVQLESEKYKAAVRLTWDNQKKTWLLTMFEKKNSALDNTTDTDKTHKGNGNDTATPENTVVSDRKDIDFASDKQANGEESLPQFSDNKRKSGLQAAVEAASAEVNTEPTEAQKKAGNYKKGHVTIGSFDITIENPAGSVRRGVDADGKEWSTTMANAYGEIRGTQSVDGDPIDVFLASDMDAWNGRKVFVVDQTNADGSFDEHKVMLGFNDKDEAMGAYLANYDKTWADTHPGIRITEANLDDFQKWVESSHRKTKAFADYSMVKGTAEAPAQGKNAESGGDETARIEDFGEKIAGARKDMLRDVAKSVENVTEQSLIELPMGKAFKRPNLKKMVDGGVISDDEASLAEAVMQGLVYAKNKPVATRSPRRQREIKEWANETYEGIRLLGEILSGDPARRDKALEERKARQAEKLAEMNRHIDNLREWNPGKEFSYLTELPDEVEVVSRVLKGIGHKVGEKINLPLCRLEVSSTGKGYTITGPGKQGALWFKKYHNTVDEAIETMIFAARLARGDRDVEIPGYYLSVKGVGRPRMERTGKYEVAYWAKNGKDIKTKLFSGKKEAEEFATAHSGKVTEQQRYVNEYESYTVTVKNPLTGNSLPIGGGSTERVELIAMMDEQHDELNALAVEAIAKETGTKSAPRDHFFVATTWERGKIIYSIVSTDKNNPWPIVKDFATRKEAEAWYGANRERLEAERRQRMESEKSVVYFETGVHRRGKDHRSGRHATPEMYDEQFGFRGVQFGNWTNDTDRQMAMDQAYDALMDLSEQLGISPRAMSLYGELGLAFGARGCGNASAHYEPVQVVINLTKTKGAGSLAHEWWHALDNYLSRRAGVALGHATHGHGSDKMDPDVASAVARLMEAVLSSQYGKRSLAKGEYWGRPTEMGARLFETWISERIKAEGNRSPFLVSGISQNAIDLFHSLNYLVYRSNEARVAEREKREPHYMSKEEFIKTPEALNGYPYPVIGELEALSPSLENLFNILRENERTDGMMAKEPRRRYGRAKRPTMTGRTLFDWADDEARAQRDTPAKDERDIAADDANAALDEYAEAYNDYLERTENLEAQLEAEGVDETLRAILREQADAEETMLLEGRDRLRESLRQYYVRENTPEDAERITRDMVSRLEAEIEVRRRGKSVLADILEERTPAEGTAQPTNEARTSQVKTAGGYLTYQAQGHLPDAREGEFAYVERQFSRTGEFSFTGSDRIIDRGDVAYIFRSLEDYSNENVFAVLVKHGQAKIIHIGMGGPTSSVADMGAIRAGVDAFGADKIYLVHNHPSGNLNPSEPDRRLVRALETAFGSDIKTEGIIMDTTSGRYTTFDSLRRTETFDRPREESSTNTDHEVYRLNHADRSGMPENIVQIKSPQDVKTFLGNLRFGGVKKVSYLILSTNHEIIGHFHTGYTTLEDAGLAEEIASVAEKFGGTTVVVYGNMEITKSLGLKEALKNKSLNTITLLDVVGMRGGIHRSAIDEGVLREESEPYGSLTEVREPMTRETSPQNIGKNVTENERLSAIRALKPIKIERNSMSREELFAIYKSLPTVNKDGNKIRFLRTAFGKNYKEGGLFAQISPRLNDVLSSAVLAYSEKDSLGGTTRPDGTKHKAHPNVLSFDNYVNKVSIENCEYYVRMTVQNTVDNTTGLHSCFVSDIDLYENTAIGRTDSAISRRPNDSFSGIVDAKLQQFFERASSVESKNSHGASEGENGASDEADSQNHASGEADVADVSDEARISPEAKRSHAEKLANKFNTPITIVDDVENLPAAMRNKKGGYDVRNGNVIVVIPNHADVEDVAETVFHEVVAHKGLREMLGEENYDAFCDEIYGHLKDDLKRQVDTEAGRRFMREPEKGYEHHRRVAVDELFGRMAEKGFEDFTKAERGIWAKLKAKVLEAINKFLGSLKLPKWVRLGDNELRYILWRSHERLGARAKAQEQVQNGALDFVDMARDVAKRAELGLNKSDVIVTRSRKTTADRIEESFDAAVAGELTGKPVEIGRLTKEGREYLEKLSGLKLKDVVSFVLNPSDLAHIYRRHFGKNETDARNIPLTKDDIRQMAYVVSSPDKVIFGKEKSGNQRNMFFFLKETDNGSYNLMEVYSDRKGNLTAKSYFKSKEGVSQRAMLLNESSTLTSVTDGATLSDSAKLPKFFESATISEEESFDFRYRDGETGDIWKDQSIGLEEKITNAALRLSKAQADDLTLRNDAMTAIGNNLKSLLHEMRNRRGTTQKFAGADHKVEANIAKAKAAQLRYDRSTVKRVGDLARILMQTGYLSDMTSGEILRLMSAVKNSVGGNDIESSVDKIMDIMIGNQLRNAEDALHSLLSIRGSKVDSRGVEVQGELDIDGQRTIEVVKRTINLNEDDITSLMDDARDRMGDSDKIIADNAAIEYAGLNMALDYAQNIANSKAEETALRYDLKTANEDMKVGRLTENAYKQLVDSIDEAIRKNKIERAEAYFNLVGRLSDSLRESIENAKAFRNAEKARVREIQHNANSDMEGRPSNEHHKDDWKDKMANNGFVQFVLAPLGTFDQILRTFGNKSANGEGYLWNRFMRGWVDCRNKELLGVKNKFARLDEKVAEICDRYNTLAKARGDSKNIRKIKNMADMIKLDGKLPTATVKFWDGGEMREHELTQGNLLYIYMVDKMTDGRMKLRRMGITEEDIASVEKALDPRFKEFGDWLQEEFLVDTRNEYNETHKRIFGASMAAVENYFPLKILSNARTDKEEDLDQQWPSDGITTKTGSIIKRRTNSLALDIMGSNALSVVLDHITEMEHWNAYVEWNRDLNALRTYKRFRNQVMNMTTAYGGGEKLWKRFNKLCRMAAGRYRPPISELDKAAVNIAKGVTAAKVSFRIFTALKQFLSAPAYIPEVSTASIAKSLANPYGDFKWCMENLPIFYERWHSRISGDPRLLKTDHDWKTWREGIVAVAARLGMTPNAFVDALTVSIGARAMYQTRLKRYLKEGYTDEEAEKRAKQDATILFNQTQQSSEAPFMSTMQADRTWINVLFTVFRNSSMSYTRQEYDALRNLKRNLTPGQRAKSIEFMTKQILRDWDIDPDTATDAERDQAQSAAKKRFRRQLKKDVVRLATFGFILPLAWNLGAYLPYIIFGDDEDEKDKMWDDALTHAYFGSVEGLSGGDVMSSFGNMWASGEWNERQLTKDMPLASDISAIIKKFAGGKNIEAINDIVNLAVQSGIGVNPQSITDVVVAITDACGDDPRLSHEAAICIMRILQVPQSQLDKMYFDEVGLSGREISQYTPGQLAQRYAEYRIMRGTPFVPWTWGDEEQQSKYEKSAQKEIKERLAGREDDEVVAAYEDLDDRYKSFTKKIGSVKEMMGTDYIAAAQEAAELQNDPDFKIYQKRNALDAALDKAMRKWPPQRRERVKDLRLEGTVAGVPQSKLSIKASEQKKVSLTGELNRIANKYFTAETPEEARLIADTMAKYRALIVDAMQTDSEAEQEAAISELSTLIHDFRTKEEEMRSTKR